MILPIVKNFWTINHSVSEHLSNYDECSEIPIGAHPGAFGTVRKNHCHEGVDLYCNEGEKIYAMESGRVVNILQFTGEKIGSPWWHDTWAVLIEGESGVFNYGEIIPNDGLTVGKIIKEGDLIGNVTTVLKKNKGRPMNMLHLELYDIGTINPIHIWDLGMERPIHLKDPTEILLKLIQK
jgi:Peptidase family M23